MTFRIDRTRAAVTARAVRTEDEDAEEVFDVEHVNLPVPVSPVTRQPRGERRGGESAFFAQMMGQDGQKRGLRGGQPVLDAARNLYSKVEWSGSWDRRARQGRRARTSI